MLFHVRPDNFQPSLDVVGIFVLCNNQMLLLLRNSEKPFGNTWGQPAGKVEKNETTKAAALRELKEETGLKLKAEELSEFTVVFVDNGENSFPYHIFWCNLDYGPDIRIDPKSHQEYKWVTPEQALQMNLIHDMDECIRMFFQI